MAEEEKELQRVHVDYLNAKLGNKRQVYRALTATNGANLYLPSLTSPAVTSAFLQAQLTETVKCLKNNEIKYGRPARKCKLIELFTWLSEVIIDPSEWGLTPQRLPDANYLTNMLATIDPNHPIFRLASTKDDRNLQEPVTRLVRQEQVHYKRSIASLDLQAGKGTRGFFKKSGEEKLQIRLSKAQARKQKNEHRLRMLLKANKAIRRSIQTEEIQMKTLTRELDRQRRLYRLRGEEEKDNVGQPASLQTLQSGLRRLNFQSETRLSPAFHRAGTPVPNPFSLNPPFNVSHEEKRAESQSQAESIQLLTPPESAPPEDRQEADEYDRDEF